MPINPDGVRPHGFFTSKFGTCLAHDILLEIEWILQFLENKRFAIIIVFGHFENGVLSPSIILN